MGDVDKRKEGRERISYGGKEWGGECINSSMTVNSVDLELIDLS